MQHSCKSYILNMSDDEGRTVISQKLRTFKTALGYVIADPATYLDMRALCPHIDPVAAEHAFNSGRPIALPATYITGAYWILWGKRGKCFATACRTPESFPKQKVSHHNRSGNALAPGHSQAFGLEAALDYHFSGQQLHHDVAVDTIRFDLLWWQHITVNNASKIRTDTTKTVTAYGALTVPAADLLRIKKTNERLEQIANSLVSHGNHKLLTLDGVYGQEIVSFLPTRLRYCGDCGKHLSKRSCQHDTPSDLPRPVRALFAKGGQVFKHECLRVRTS